MFGASGEKTRFGVSSRSRQGSRESAWDKRASTFKRDAPNAWDEAIDDKTPERFGGGAIKRRKKLLDACFFTACFVKMEILAKTGKIFLRGFIASTRRATVEDGNDALRRTSQGREFFERRALTSGRRVG